MDLAAEMLAKAREERDRRRLAGPAPKPTFDCASAKLAVEKAICADPQLAKLDRQVDEAYKAALGKLGRRGVARLRREQREFIARRDREFGSADYHFKRELERRLARLRDLDD
jgi:uncharacterized protein